MKKRFDYFKYEEKATLNQLHKLSKAQTFRLGLDLSDFALKMLYQSLEDRFKNISHKAILAKFRACLRNN